MDTPEHPALAPGLRPGEQYWPAPAVARAAALRELETHRHWQESPDIWACFGSLDDLLHAAHQRWLHALVGALDAAVEAGSEELSDDIHDAWVATQRALPVLRQLLDEHADHPALVEATAYERRVVAQAAGVSDPTELMHGLTTSVVPLPRRGLMQRVLGRA